MRNRNDMWVRVGLILALILIILYIVFFQKPEKADAHHDRNGMWSYLADCESGEWDRRGRPIRGTARWNLRKGAHEGGLQFAPRTWDANKPAHAAGNAADAHIFDVIFTAERVLERQGVRAWPTCGPKTGLHK